MERFYSKHGCGDGYCVFGRPPGMHTNAGCCCLRDLKYNHNRRDETRKGIVEMREYIKELEDKLEDIEKANKENECLPNCGLPCSNCGTEVSLGAYCSGCWE